MADDTVFKINGQEVALPEIDSFTLDEAMVLYDYSHLTLDMIQDVEGVHPGLLAAMLHVAIQRLNPDMKPAEVKRTVSSVNLMELLKSLPAEGEAEVPPTPSASGEKTDDSEPSSGAASETSSESQAETVLPRSGMRASVSTLSLPTKLAV